MGRVIELPARWELLSWGGPASSHGVVHMFALAPPSDDRAVTGVASLCGRMRVGVAYVHESGVPADTPRCRCCRRLLERLDDPDDELTLDAVMIRHARRRHEARCRTVTRARPTRRAVP